VTTSVKLSPPTSPKRNALSGWLDPFTGIQPVRASYEMNHVVPSVRNTSALAAVFATPRGLLNFPSRRIGIISLRLCRNFIAHGTENPPDST
jgi:hypothetical protein